MTIVEMREPSSGRSPVASPSASVSQPAGELAYRGGRWRLFGLAFSRMVLTIVTLGVGRFWMVTRLRRHYWSSLEIDGAPLEYTGRASEKLIGFLIAVVILAVYLTVVNLALTFIGLSYFQGHLLALQLPLLALIPFVPWAIYRARRYILARTRWRGIRFGMEPGAWGFSRRYLQWWALTLLSFGLLYPLMQLRLSQFATDRSFYGDLQFRQEGRLKPLMRSWLWVWAPTPIVIGLAIIAGVQIGAEGFERLAAEAAKETGDDASANPREITLIGGVVIAAFLALIWSLIAYVRHRVFSFRYLSSNKVLGGRTRLEFSIRTWPVVGVYFRGYLIIQIGVAIAVIAVALLTLIGLALAGADIQAIADAMEAGSGDFAAAPTLIFAAAVYFTFIVVSISLTHAFISHPLLRKVVATTRIHDLAGAARARQRAHDEQAEAGGFADALGADNGGAF